MHARVICLFRSFMLRCALMPRRRTAVLTGLMIGTSVMSATPIQERNSPILFTSILFCVERHYSLRPSAARRLRHSLPCVSRYRRRSDNFRGHLSVYGRHVLHTLSRRLFPQRCQRSEQISFLVAEMLRQHDSNLYQQISELILLRIDWHSKAAESELFAVRRSLRNIDRDAAFQCPDLSLSSEHRNIHVNGEVTVEIISL